MRRGCRHLAVAAALPLLAGGCAMADIGEGEDPALEEVGLELDNGFLDNGPNLANGLNLGNGTCGKSSGSYRSSGLQCRSGSCKKHVCL